MTPMSVLVSPPAHLATHSFIFTSDPTTPFPPASNPPPLSLTSSLHGGCTAKEPRRPGSLLLTGSLHWSVCWLDTSTGIWLLSAGYFRGWPDTYTHTEQDTHTHTVVCIHEWMNTCSLHLTGTITHLGLLQFLTHKHSFHYKFLHTHTTHTHGGKELGGHE